jgi:hypothetical protein
LGIAGQLTARFPKKFGGGISANAFNAADSETVFSILISLRSSRSPLSAQSIPNLFHHRLTDVDHPSAYFQYERAAMGLISTADVLVHFLRELVRLSNGHDVFGNFFHTTALTSRTVGAKQLSLFL